jgi:hypothetical protein
LETCTRNGTRGKGEAIMDGNVMSDRMKDFGFLTWESVKGKVHDISGISKMPDEYYYYCKSGIWYPYLGEC